MHRRYFIGTALAAAATPRRAVSANEKVNVAMVGVGGRGRGLTANIAKLADAHISYLVDVDQASLERASKVLEPLQKARPSYVSDMRRALDDKSVDAIVVATPDHWHGPATILGCDAGRLDMRIRAPAPSVRLTAVTAGLSVSAATASVVKSEPLGGVNSAVTAKCPDSRQLRSGLIVSFKMTPVFHG